MLIETDEDMRRVLAENKSLAVIGMKQPGEGPAWNVPAYLRKHAYTTVAVNPKYDDIAGVVSVPSVSALPEPVDMFVIFRRSEAVEGIADEILALEHRPRAVWMQLGIRNEAAAQKLAAEGIDVVQDHCAYVEHARLIGE